ncbi:MAG: hypothetical protein JWM85_1961 [Acidimicrobiaceae bacterium]|nr:hypothetical protein [Acidimicrobiaceae bacterium]
MATTALGGDARSAARETGAGWILRFDAVERVVHWTNAVLFAVLVFTGAALYFSPLIALIGRRSLVEEIHLYIGLFLPVPLLLALSGRWGRALRRDLRRFNRWSETDRRWLRSAFRGQSERDYVRRRLSLGKFNAGQKINAAFTVGAALVMLGTGSLLRWYRPFPLSWRAGSTFVHNWLALFFVIVIAGHVLMALTHPAVLRSMLFGRISRRWADDHAPGWVDELVLEEADATEERSGPKPTVPAAPRGTDAETGGLA